jgi:hypothetical protein
MEEEKILYYFINNAYRDEGEYVRLSETNIKFLDWLYKHDYLSEDTVFSMGGDLPKVVEF